MKIERLDEKDLPKRSRKFRMKTTGSLRFNTNISWFPAPSTMQKNLTDDRSSLGAHQIQHGILPPIAGRSEYIFFPFHFTYRNGVTQTHDEIDSFANIFVDRIIRSKDEWKSDKTSTRKIYVCGAS